MLNPRIKIHQRVHESPLLYHAMGQLHSAREAKHQQKECALSVPSTDFMRGLLFDPEYEGDVTSKRRAPPEVHGATTQTKTALA
jgi:hypothetical protein